MLSSKLLCIVGIVTCAVCTPFAHATLIAGESFPTTLGGGSGNYAHQVALAGQGTGVAYQSGFSGPYAGNASKGLQPDMNGIVTPAFAGAAGGSIQINSGRDNRPLATYTPANTYYFAGTMGGHTALTASQDTLIEFSNSNAGGNVNFDGNSRGFQFGLKGANAIVRARSTFGNLTDFVISNTYSTDLRNANVFVGRLDVNPLGNQVDRITVYFNATDYSTEALAASTGTTVTFDTDAMTTNADIRYLGFASVGGGGGYTRGDELRFGTTYADATAPLPEPATLGALALLATWPLTRRRPRP